jgi:transcriptional regulator of acetoin/glycerol metabolism
MVRLTTSDGKLRPFDVIVDDVIQLAIIHCEGNKSHAARGLRLARSTFYRRLRDGA